MFDEYVIAMNSSCSARAIAIELERGMHRRYVVTPTLLFSQISEIQTASFDYESAIASYKKLRKYH